MISLLHQGTLLFVSSVLFGSYSFGVLVELRGVSTKVNNNNKRINRKVTGNEEPFVRPDLVFHSLFRRRRSRTQRRVPTPHASSPLLETPEAPPPQDRFPSPTSLVEKDIETSSTGRKRERENQRSTETRPGSRGRSGLKFGVTLCVGRSGS